MGMPPWENPAMTEASDKCGISNPEAEAEGLREKTYRTVATNPGLPRGRGVYNSEMLLHTVRTSRRFGNQMSGCRFGPLDLDKAFRAYRLIATPRIVDVHGIILSLPQRRKTRVPRLRSRVW